MTRTLDRKRTFGTIIGESQNGARYQQNGLDFDGQGRQVNTEKAEFVSVKEYAVPVEIDLEKDLNTEIVNVPSITELEPVALDGDVQYSDQLEPEPEPEPPHQTSFEVKNAPLPAKVKTVSNAPKIKNWTKKAVMNHMRMKFPDVEIDATIKTAEMKDKLRALYADNTET